MTEHADPSFRAGTTPKPEPLLARFGDVGERERWGYGVWSLMGLVIAVPEIWAAVGTPPWPTISATVGHLEARWNWVAILVVALIVVVAVRAASYLLQPQTDKVVTPAAGQGQRRTATGRFTMNPDKVGEASERWTIVYFAIAIVVVAAAGLFTASRSSDKWLLAYVIYGLIALFFVVLPNVAVLRFKDLPYSTLFHTIDDLEGRWHQAAMVILAGLVVLLIHLAFYPWPHVVQPPTTNSA